MNIHLTCMILCVMNVNLHECIVWVEESPHVCARVRGKIYVRGVCVRSCLEWLICFAISVHL